MSTTTTSAAAATTSAATNCGPQVYEIPTTDAACAVLASSSKNVSDVMNQCCGVADVHSYDNDCGLYCLAQGQSVGKLTDCLTGNGVGYANVFCNHNQTTTATATASTTKATGSGSSSSSSSTGASAAATSAGAAVANVRAPEIVSKSGLGILILLFGSTLLGALA